MLNFLEDTFYFDGFHWSKSSDRTDCKYFSDMVGEWFNTKLGCRTFWENVRGREFLKAQWTKEVPTRNRNKHSIF